MDTITVLGATGATLLLIAFILNQLHLWKNNYLWYDLCNAVGSALLMGYALLLVSYPFMILNFVWLCVSARDVIQDVRNINSRQRSFFSKWLR